MEGSIVTQASYSELADSAVVWVSLQPGSAQKLFHFFANLLEHMEQRVSVSFMVPRCVPRQDGTQAVWADSSSSRPCWKASPAEPCSAAGF